MKFGKSIQFRKEGHHSDLHYVDYKVLKKDIKDVVTKVQSSGYGDALAANMAFEAELAGEIKQVNACFTQRQQELMNLVDRMAGELRSCTSPRAQEAANEAGSALADPPQLLRRLVDVLLETDQLRMYAVWNAVAVVKILKKRRKRTKFGLEDMAGERTGWLSRQNFFNGAQFAELHAAIESLGDELVRLDVVPPDLDHGAVGSREPVNCPICLDEVSDCVELACGHCFCWRCFVLGPIAHQPGQYCISECPLCRQETLGDAFLARQKADSKLSLFLHTYFPEAQEGHREGDQPGAQQAGALQGLDEHRNVVGELVEALLGDVRRGLPKDFLLALPQSSGPMGAAQKTQWLQLASTGDPLALDGTSMCSVCNEPMLHETAEATVTTPCKHKFHRACVQRLEAPLCPICQGPLPFAWYLPPEHPCVESGFRTVLPAEYRPPFAGGPSIGTGGYPLHSPPPEHVHGPNGLRMRSYLHLTVPATPTMPTGAEFLGADPELEQTPAIDHEQASPQVWDPDLVDDLSSASNSGDDSSSAESREDRLLDASYAHSALGRMRLVEAPAAAESPPEPLRAAQQTFFANPPPGLAPPPSTDSHL